MKNNKTEADTEMKNEHAPVEVDVYYNSLNYDLKEHDKALGIRQITDLGFFTPAECTIWSLQNR